MSLVNKYSLAKRRVSAILTSNFKVNICTFEKNLDCLSTNEKNFLVYVLKRVKLFEKTNLFVHYSNRYLEIYRRNIGTKVNNNLSTFWDADLSKDPHIIYAHLVRA